MKIVVDANRIIAALLKQSTTRDILFDDTFEFVTPEYTRKEIEEHREELKKKAKLSDEGFELVLALVFERMTILPEPEYSGFIEECEKELDDCDDAPYLAASIATKAIGIWSHDPHLLKQKKARIFTNIDMLRMKTSDLSEKIDERE